MSVGAPDEAVSIEARCGGAPETDRSHATRVHATCVEIQTRGVLLLGPPGSGKSDLAARLIDCGGMLVADDQVLVQRQDRMLIAWPPETLAGLLEIRGLGILKLPFCAAAPLRLAVELVAGSDLVRLPGPLRYPLLGLELPSLRLDPRQASAAAIVRLALRAERIA